MNANALVTLPPIAKPGMLSRISSQTRIELKAAACGLGIWTVYVGTVHTAHFIARLAGTTLDAHNVNIGATIAALAVAGVCYLRRRRSVHY
jgi:hypothetical protein